MTSCRTGSPGLSPSATTNRRRTCRSSRWSTSWRSSRRRAPRSSSAIGTGRIALPLAQRGVRVAGIDLSPDMVAQLRKKPGGDEIPVAIGDYAATTRRRHVLARLHRLQLDQQPDDAGRQVATFDNAAAHLEPGGCFVVEVGVGGGAPLEVFDLSDTHVGVDEYDAATQRLVSHHFTLVDGRWERLSMPFRSVSPGELDLMARLAGMRLRERWSGWDARAVHEREHEARLGLGEGVTLDGADGRCRPATTPCRRGSPIGWRRSRAIPGSASSPSFGSRLEARRARARPRLRCRRAQDRARAGRAVRRAGGRPFRKNSSARARENVPHARVRPGRPGGSSTSPDGTFDAVTAFYSLSARPPRRARRLCSRVVARWLRRRWPLPGHRTSANGER